ncbi:MAG: redoxin domain-containing protein [Fusobacteriaceae bacterium]|jgi:peroxiredoxin|nr:redoxin domain-containing protein [Fusobacteriaceae bacterium]
MKLATGMKMPDFTFDSIYRDKVDYLESKKGKTGVLMFLRYFGCRICQLDIREFNLLYDEFVKLGADVKIVLQSTREIMLEAEEKEGKFKTEFVLDPTQALYKRFELAVAKDKDELRGQGQVEKKSAEAQALGMVHGAYEGEELQLPAAFIIDKDDNIVYARYAAHGADIPRAAEVLEILKK